MFNTTLAVLRPTPGKNPLEVELKLLKRVPEDYRLHAHHWLLLHGRHVCKARHPDCPACAVRDCCGFKGKSAPRQAAPAPVAR